MTKIPLFYKGILVVLFVGEDRRQNLGCCGMYVKIKRLCEQPLS